MTAKRTELEYQSGFRNSFETEALHGALPVGRNSPQRAPYGLYAEQFSGTAFTAPRGSNLRSWLYRIRPSVVQSSYRRVHMGRVQPPPGSDAPVDPTQMRWDPLPFPESPTDLVEGLFTMAGSGDAATQSGCTVYLYACNRDMTDRFFCDADGELLLVPQHGVLRLRTEMGTLDAAPGDIAVLPRGLKFQARLVGGESARGYVCENHGALLRLPDLGPIGANGLANPRDFLTPVAAYEQAQGRFELIGKLHGHLWVSDLDHSPLDVVAWHGNYGPYLYHLARFNAINTVSFDHPDPSIFTVLTSPSDTPGTANVDFVIFPPRWMVAEDTFRPPYFHRNVMSEFMGLIRGAYDAKAEGFVPGAASLHNCMTPHGPDAETFRRASTRTLEPEYQGETLAFMFESRYVFRPTEQAVEAEFRQGDYPEIWQGLEARFDPRQP